MDETIANVGPQSSSEIKRRNQNFIGVWFHDKSYPSGDTHETMLKHLNATFEYIRVYNDLLSFTSCLLKEELVANVVVIISSSLHARSLSDLVVEQAKKENNKFMGPYLLLFETTNIHCEHRIFMNIDELFVEIGKDIEHRPQQPVLTESEVATTQLINEFKYNSLFPPVGVMNTPIKQNSIRHLSNESLRFVHFQALIEILFCMQHDVKLARDDMLSDCRVYYQNNIAQLYNIKDFDNNYTGANAIFYYTQDSFCHRMVNMAFRSEDIEHIFRYRLFITDLHKELSQKANENRAGHENVVIYRGKKLPNTILQQLKDSVQKLISINGFLSTTKNLEAAKKFSGDGEMRDNHSSVIFELHIQNLSNYNGKPFADISVDADLYEMDDEQEVLFSVGTVWRIEGIQKKDHLWYIRLNSCADFDDDLRGLLANLTDGYTLLSIGNLLEELGEDTKAEKFYRHMLENESNIKAEQKGLLYFRIGMLRKKSEDYFGALDALNKAIPYFPQLAVPSEETSSLTSLITNANGSNRLAIYFNIGIIHYRNKSLKEAQKAWEHALTEEGPPEITAKVCDGLAQLAHAYGNLEEATKYYKKALESINNSSAREDVKNQFKRKFDEATRLSDEMDKRWRSKRQRTGTGSEAIS